MISKITIGMCCLNHLNTFKKNLTTTNKFVGSNRNDDAFAVSFVIKALDMSLLALTTKVLQCNRFRLKDLFWWSSLQIIWTMHTMLHWLLQYDFLSPSILQLFRLSLYVCGADFTCQSILHHWQNNTLHP